MMIFKIGERVRVSDNNTLNKGRNGMEGVIKNVQQNSETNIIYNVEFGRGYEATERTSSYVRHIELIDTNWQKRYE